jgi:threonine/homoserine/homoserine lactone efflux protein
VSDLAILLAFWAAFALALVSPGPNFTVLLGTSLQAGRPAALRVAAGMVIGEVIWGLAAVFGVAALAAENPWMAAALRVGGGAFLLYLAAMSLRSALRDGRSAEAPAAATPSPGGGIGRGLGLMLLNPKAGVFWVSLTGLFIHSDQSVALSLTAVAGAATLSLLWHASLALAFTTAAVMRFYMRLRRGLESVLGVVLAGLGLRLIVSS